MGEVPAWAAHFPDAFVRILPGILEESQQAPLQRPSLLRRFELTHAPLVECVEHLAVHVQLELIRSCVAHTNRFRSFVARQPVECQFEQPALAGDAVHDLQRRRVAGSGAEQPDPPGTRLLEIAGVQEGEQRQGGVSQPAVTVVPVALAADLLGQRRGRRRDDPAGRGIREALEDRQRRLHFLFPFAGVAAAARPVLPVLIGLVQRVLGVDRTRRSLVRRVPRQREGDALTLPHGELADGAQVLTPMLDRSPEAKGIRSCDRDTTVGNSPQPRDRAAVVEADDQLGEHVDVTA